MFNDSSIDIKFKYMVLVDDVCKLLTEVEGKTWTWSLKFDTRETRKEYTNPSSKLSIQKRSNKDIDLDRFTVSQFRN